MRPFRGLPIFAAILAIVAIALSSLFGVAHPAPSAFAADFTVASALVPLDLAGGVAVAPPGAIPNVGVATDAVMQVMNTNANSSTQTPGDPSTALASMTTDTRWLDVLMRDTQVNSERILSDQVPSSHDVLLGRVTIGD